MLKNIAGLLVAAALSMPVLASPHHIKPKAAKAHPHPVVNSQVPPRLSSHSVLVLNATNGDPLFEKNIRQRMPIASISKLMTAMVLLDSGVSLDQEITISDAEIDRLKNSASRLAVGTTLPRRELLLLALMSSENRAASALARSIPGGLPAFIVKMNHKARSLGMTDTVFYDPTGLDMRNTSTAADLAKMVRAAEHYPLIREFTTTANHQIVSVHNRVLQYKNSNALVREGNWEISLQKTGYIQEAGHCMVMRTTVGSQPVIFVLLDAAANSSRVSDARNLKTWIEAHPNNWLTSAHEKVATNN